MSVKRGTVTPSGRQRFRFNAIRPAGGQAREGERTGRGLQPGAHVPAVRRRSGHGRLGVHVGVVVVVIHSGRHRISARRVHRVPRGTEHRCLGLEAARAKVGVFGQCCRLPWGLAQGPWSVASGAQLVSSVCAQQEGVHIVVAQGPGGGHRCSPRLTGPTRPAEIMKLQISCNNLVAPGGGGEVQSPNKLPAPAPPLATGVTCPPGRTITRKSLRTLLMARCFAVIIFIAKAICFYAKGSRRSTIWFVLIVANED